MLAYPSSVEPRQGPVAARRPGCGAPASRTPVLASKLLPPNMEHEEKENALMRFLHRIYAPSFEAALRRPRP